MRIFRSFLLASLCMGLLLGTGCQHKGIPCPKPIGKKNRVKMMTQAGQEIDAVKVSRDKNGRVKKGGWRIW